MKAFVSAVAAIIVIAVGANLWLTDMLDFSARSVYQGEHVRLGANEVAE